MALSTPSFWRTFICFFLILLATALVSASGSRIISDDQSNDVYSVTSFGAVKALIQDFQQQQANAETSSFLIWFVVVHDESCKAALPMEDIISIASNASISVIDIHLRDDDNDDSNNDRILLHSMGLSTVPATFLVTANHTASYLVPWILPLELLLLAPSWLNGDRGNHTALVENEFVPRELLGGRAALEVFLQESTILPIARQTSQEGSTIQVVVLYTCNDGDNESFTQFARYMYSHPELIFLYVRQCDREGQVDVWENYQTTTTDPSHTWDPARKDSNMDLSSFLLAIGAPDVLTLSDRLHAAPIALAMDTQAVFIADDEIATACAAAAPLSMACVAVSARTEQRVVTTLHLQPGRLTIVDTDHALHHQPPDMDVKTFVETYDTIAAGTTPRNATFTIHDGHLRWLTPDSAFLSPAQQRGSVWLAMHPTCGHCQRILPIYRKLGHLLDSLGWTNTLLYVVNVMDIESGVAVDWVPTLVYNQKHRVVLDTNFRHEHDLLEWIVQHMDRQHVMQLSQALEQQERK